MIFNRLIDNIDAYIERDPAAGSRAEVLIAHSGLHAVIWHRLANWLWRHRWRMAARFFAWFARWVTGIEIHPEAVIGERLVIDHGMGVVIGQTAEIADDVTLYHGVTLGGIAPAVDSKSQRNVKRHPTILKGAIVGSGAQVLGPITVGEGARVGANAVVVKDVDEGCTVVGIPAKPVPSASCKVEGFSAYGMPIDEIPDPVLRAVGGLLDEISALKARVGELEREQDDLKGPTIALGEGDPADKVGPGPAQKIPD
ncbi:MAG: serine O-acetyltransferase [Alphaproteobacteria bacterium]|nr:serine O-acetyltransferase [Alphaproteobacteria bacterium]